MSVTVRSALAALLAAALVGCAAGGVANLDVASEPSANVTDDAGAAAPTTVQEVAAQPTPEPPEPVDEAVPVYVADPDQPLEEVTVTAERLLTVDERQRIYNELAKGRRLFARNQIAEALPYLLNTAERGFKDSQAKVGHIYLTGLGEVDPDSEQAVGWLGVASSGTTSPTIRNYFNDVWKRIPERYVPYFEEVVEEYTRKYGERATGVVCQLSRPLRSNLKTLGCYFEKELGENVRVSHEEYRQTRQSIQLAEQQMREQFLLRDEMRASDTRGN